MGNKVSAVHGVKSDHFYDQGNAINEIWIGDVEVISRLPFGDSDLEQAGWPPGGFPKIPWHHFIIPLRKRAEASNMSAAYISLDTNHTACTCRDWLPQHGYLGMYSGITPDAAYLIGILLLSSAVALYMIYAYISLHALDSWLMLQNLSVFTPDPVRFKRDVWRDLWVGLARGYLAIVVCVLCMVLGLPALAAGTRGTDASTFILLNGMGVGIGVLVAGFVLQPLGLLWLGQQRSARTEPPGQC